MERPSVLFRISSVIFRSPKYVKKGYMEMTKKIYLETLKSVLGRSILHYLYIYTYIYIHIYIYIYIFFHGFYML